MQYKPDRQSIRKRDYDYSRSGYYFVTICIKNGESHFGEVLGGSMHFSESGEIVDDCIRSMNGDFNFASVTTHVVMPNHVHILMHLNETCERTGASAMKLGEIVRLLKGKSAYAIHKAGVTFRLA